jgi:diacylglycerol kinase family enzyme
MHMPRPDVAHAAGGLPLPCGAPSTAPALPAGRPLHVVAVDTADARHVRLCQALLRHAEEAGRRLVMHTPTHPAGLAVAARQAATAAQTDGGVVVAIGGDGTLNTAGQACWSLGVPLAVLAQGTFNFFARQQRLPLEMDAALGAMVQALSAGQLRPVQVGLVNGQMFLVNASLGLYPRLLAEREQASRRFGRHRLVALLAGAASLLRPHFGHRLHLMLRGTHGQTHSSVQLASTLFVGNNALQLRSVGLPEAQAVQRGALGVVALAPQRPPGMLRVLWRAWRGRLVDDPAVHNFACSGLTVLADPRRFGAGIQVAFDGERRRMCLPVQFSVGARPLWLVAGPLAEVQASADAQPTAGMPATPRAANGPPGLPAAPLGPELAT